MAKISQVSPRSTNDDEQESVVDTDVNETVKQIDREVVKSNLDNQTLLLGQKIEAINLAMMEIANDLDVVNRAVASLNTRMETEREARLKASTDMLCNMDQAELSEKLLDLCLNKYLDYEQNRFDKLAEDPAMTRDGARMIVQMHKHLTAGLEQALRMS